jgi:putative ABC transport system ATP-binding protein
MTPSALSVQQVFHFVGPKRSRLSVLEDVSFDLEKGEFLCVMGPSGSGKSTLLHLVAGLDSPDAGVIKLAGVELSSNAPAKRTKTRRNGIGYVFQFFNLLPNLTVLENVGLPLAIKGRTTAQQHARCQELLDRFGIGDRGGAFPHELSGGEMQRVSIARALAGDQPLLLCDEPTGNLSQKAGLEIMKTLRGVCESDGKSVLLVTHNPRDATFADRVLFLVDGGLSNGHELARDGGEPIPVDTVHGVLKDLGI